MATVTKKELIDRIADNMRTKRVLVKKIVQAFLDEMIDELGRGNRLEFRDFGVFESRTRRGRTAQNPKTLDKVRVPPKRTVKFKVGRLMKQKLISAPLPVDQATGLPVEAAAANPTRARSAKGKSASVLDKKEKESARQTS